MTSPALLSAFSLAVFVVGIRSVLSIEVSNNSYAASQCNEPIAVVDARTTLPEKPGIGQNYWRGKCVKAQFQDWGQNCSDEAPCGATHSINIRVARTLPNPGTCSAEAKQFNGGPKPPNWDFSGPGYCGAGDCKHLLTSCTPDVRQTAMFHYGRLACLAHDVCVWSRCQNDALRPNFIVAMGGVKKMIQSMLSGNAGAELRKGDSACGSVLFDTMNAYYDADNSRIARFFKLNPSFKKDGSNWPADGKNRATHLLFL